MQSFKCEYSSSNVLPRADDPGNDPQIIWNFKNNIVLFLEKPL